MKAGIKKTSTGGFGHYNLDLDIVKAIRTKGYNMPTPIQRKAIPAIM
jgi:ATP-dependent RNA helicase DDX54/DBP10